jgi:hypothetical protein
LTICINHCDNWPGYEPLNQADVYVGIVATRHGYIEEAMTSR